MPLLHEDITGRIIDAAIKVHTDLGAGLLESTYSACLQYEMSTAGLHLEHQVKLPIVYRGVHIDAGYRIDFLIESCVIVEMKAVEKLLPIHTAQLLTYLKLSAKPVGLILNFNVVHMRDGIKRLVNGYAVSK